METRHEMPWHLRHAAPKHHLWFRNLSEMHELTLAWLKQLQVERAAHLLSRGLNRELADDLWMLDPLAQSEIEPLLDDTYPDDSLGRLEHTVWAVQAFTLKTLLDRTPPEERGILDNLLEQTAWKLGRQCAENRWQHQIASGTGDLRTLLLALRDSPFSGYPHQDGFLIRRSVEEEVQLELLCCPHQQSFPDIQPVASELCQVHTHWMRGFAYSLNARVTVEHRLPTERPDHGARRCLQRWFFVG